MSGSSANNSINQAQSGFSTMGRGRFSRNKPPFEPIPPFLIELADSLIDRISLKKYIMDNFIQAYKQPRL